MKKFFSFLVLIVMCCVTIFSGCSLVTRNYEKYYDQVVAKTGDVTITMEDLLSGYNSFGYKYVTEEKMKIEDAVAKTLNDVLDRELLFEYAKNQIGTLKLYETNSIMQQVYDYINSQLLTIENEIRKELGKEIIEEHDHDHDDDEHAHEDPAFNPYEEYEKKIIYNEETNQFERVVEPEQTDDTEAIGAFVQTMNGDVEISAKAWTRYIRQLKTNEKGRNRSTVESEIFKREIDRIYEIYEKNYVIEKFQEKFTNNLDLDNLLIEIVSKYQELVRANAYDYNNDIVSYVKAMQKDASSIYYHGNGNQVTMVAHVLIKYSDEQSALITEYKSQLAQGQINQAQYDSKIENLSNQIAGHARDNEGYEIGEEIGISEILTEIQSKISAQTTLEGKAVAFNELIYKYGQDTGMINAKSYYAINLQVNDEITDTMVKTFADESRRLNSEEGAGSLSGLILSEYGYHIILNLGSPENLVSFDNLNLVTPLSLYNTKRMLGTNKSLFDEMAEKVTEYSFDTYYTSLVKQLRSENTIYKYQNVYKQLY